MQLECPHCHRTLEFSGPPPPSFCGYCGRSLAPAPEVATADAEATQAGGDSKEAVADTATLIGPSPAVSAEEATSQVGGYRLLRRLGRGGMGTVYEGVHEATGQRVAVKLIAAEFGASAEAVERFRQEGRLASSVAHPRCVFVMSVDEEAGRPYIVMELMPGQTLDDLVKQNGPLPVADALGKTLDVLDGLQEAHRLGVVHRDVKPSNCFLDADGRVKVGDFGLAKSLVGDARLTRTGTFLGTPLFASPEQVKREPVDAQSDVYSLAATLYYLIGGKAPFQTDDPLATLARIVADDPPPLRNLRPDVPPALERVILRGLERDRKRRWRTLEEFRDALTPFLPGRLSTGGLTIRFAAYLVDSFAVWLLWSALMLLLFGTLSFGYDSSHLAKMLLLASVVIGYYGLEGTWGCAAGKWLLRLRVSNLDNGAPPGLPRACVRAFLFNLLLSLNSWLVLLWMTLAGITEIPVDHERAMGFALGTGLSGIAGLLLGVGGLLLPMRKRNGYRGLHEFLSGTRVIELPWPRRRRPFVRRPVRLALTQPAGMPKRLGPYQVSGALRWQEQEKTLVAEDPALGRGVWVGLRPAGEAPLAPSRREVNRPGRVRWLAGGAHEGWQWDAFLAPAGSPLPNLVAEQRRLEWADVRPLLEQLVEELACSCDEGTLSRQLTADQVWVDVYGGMQLLGEPLAGVPRGDSDSEIPDKAGDQERALALARDVAVLCLEGRPRQPGSPAGRIAAPLPGGARRVLARLLLPGKPYVNLPELRADLRATHDLPAEVTRWQRLRHVAVQAAFLFLACSCLFLPMSVLPGLLVITMTLTLQQEGEAALEHFDRGAYITFVAGALARPTPGVLPALVVLDHDLRQRASLQGHLSQTKRDLERLQDTAPLWVSWWREQMRQGYRYQEQAVRSRLRDHPLREVVFFRNTAADLRRMREDLNKAAGHRGEVFLYMALPLLACPAAWVVWAFLTRGGVSWRIAGIALVRRDGRRAARWQCAWRALLVWAPVTLLLLASLWWGLEYYALWLTAPDESAAGVAWLATLAQTLALLLFPVYVALALWQPTRALHDRLAGSYLVPR